ncbi:MAG: hypothetical protein HYY24_04575 [Verrucomicrobia bacterium]|nr:hypothetical protein [Verrucomicrobiota bacterium]
MILGGLSMNVTGGQTPEPVPICAKFVGATSLIRNDANPAQMYCDSEIDVLAASTGGFGFTTDYRKGPRKVFVDLQSATLVQVDNPVLAATLPKGHVEFTLHQLHHNNEDGTLDDGAGGCLPTVNEVLGMAPGDSIITSPLLGFTLTGASPAASNGQYGLRFGQPVCAPNHSWDLSSDCPLRITAGYDFDGDTIIDPSEANLDASPDGSVDIWTIEPSRPDARARLIKKDKKQQLTPVGLYEVPFKLVFTREPLGAVLNLIN